MDHFSGNPSQVLKEGKRPIPPPSEISVKAGSLLFKEGDQSREVYIVKEGTLSVSQRRGTGQIELARLSDRAVFGELSLLDQQPRSATVRAITDSKLLVIAPVTFQGMLRLVPAWLLAVLKVVTHRLRETNRKLNQHTVPEPLESVSLFLCKKIDQFAITNKGTPAFPWFHWVDECCLVTRLKREELQKIIHNMTHHGFVTMNSQHELTVPDPLLIDVLRESLGFARRKDALPFQGLDPLITLCIEALRTSTGTRWESKESVLSFLQNSVDARIALSHIVKLQELEIVSSAVNTQIEANLKRILWFQKAIAESNRILGFMEASK